MRLALTESELVPHLFVNRARDADATGVGEALESRGDVDPVAINLLALDHHVAEIDTDAEFHPVLRRHARVLGFEVGLDRDPAIDRVNHASKFSQHAVTSRVDETAHDAVR